MVKKFKLSAISLALILTGCGGSMIESSNDVIMIPASHQSGNEIENYDAVATNLPAYTPSQIRTAYNMDPISTDPIALGAGQTIYVVSAYYNPNTASDLAKFNTQYNLPQCTTTTLTATTKLPLSPSTGDCSLVLAFDSGSGTLTNTVPTTNSTWSQETALDVQWAHATAPMARIVLISTSAANIASVVSSITLANKMGTGIVSMSFGAPEASYVNNYESLFKTNNMTYVAASGDSGASVNWPAVSANVIGVGGTWINANNNRIELAWNKSSGGVSSYIPKPTYQKNVNAKMRAVPDVSFNASQQSGQFVYVTMAGAKTGFWYALYGTSLAAPQWAGLLAVANAQKMIKGFPQGISNTDLYYAYNAGNSTYATNFYDIITGSDGTCSACSAGVGYDFVTGLGTPNVKNLLTTLSGGK